MSVFKPQLLPNNDMGVAIDWESLLESPLEWLISDKLDGGRVEIPHTGPGKGRSLKVLDNVHIQAMVRNIQVSRIIPEDHILEAEFYSHEMNFPEIMHFFKSEDVTSAKSKKKYQDLWNKTGGDASKGWTFPGRSVEWLTTWHESLKFHAFDLVHIKNPNTSKLDRFGHLDSLPSNPHLAVIPQRTYDSIDAIYQAFDQAILGDTEGLVIIKKSAEYKYGRHTLKSNLAYKMKDDNLDFDGKIIGVEEGTVAKEGSEKTINELGRSVTSKLKEDREPSGLAKGFLVEMEDGRTLTVSLKGYTHPELAEILNSPLKYTNQWIRFTGMAPVKAGGVPRHAMFTKGNFRDAK